MRKRRARQWTSGMTGHAVFSPIDTTHNQSPLTVFNASRSWPLTLELLDCRFDCSRLPLEFSSSPSSLPFENNPKLPCAPRRVHNHE
eukprot:1952218-Prymnesium_polylepis.2